MRHREIEGTRLASPLAAVGLAAIAMALSDIRAVAMGETNLKEWTPASWLSDIVPHAPYGLVTIAACDAFLGRHRELSLHEVRRELPRRQTAPVRSAPRLRSIAA